MHTNHSRVKILNVFSVWTSVIFWYEIYFLLQ